MVWNSNLVIYVFKNNKNDSKFTGGKGNMPIYLPTESGDPLIPIEGCVQRYY
jgi:hypothetical protein